MSENKKKIQSEEDELHKSIEVFEKELKQKKRALKELELELKVMNKEKLKMSDKMSELEKQKYHQETQLQRLEDKGKDIVATAERHQLEISMNDFTDLTEHLEIDTEAEFNRIHSEYEQKIADLQSDLDQMQPNMKAMEKYSVLLERIVKEEAEVEEIKRISNQKTISFEKVKQQRYELFMKAFQHISTTIDEVYKKLTKSTKHTLGGTAYLSLDNTEEPYNEGIRYNVMPPMKRFRPMEHLSGGEKTVAALALLFAIHSFQPSPFFVLDEVDAALDNVNVNKVSNYIQQCGFQCVVISLKDMFYEKADALVGICKDVESQCTQSFTLNMNQFK